MKDMIKLHEEGYKFREENYKYCFDLDLWRNSKSFKLIKKYCNKEDSIYEIGTLSAHHLVLLALDGYRHLKGIDFVEAAINQGRSWAEENNANIDLEIGKLKKNKAMEWDKIILFDVLEHQDNVKNFIQDVISYCNSNTEILILVPKGEEYFDNCHINFYPSIKTLTNILEKYFKVEEIREVEDGKKIFARCAI